MDERDLRGLLDKVKAGRMSRRAFVRRSLNSSGVGRRAAAVHATRRQKLSRIQRPTREK